MQISKPTLLLDKTRVLRNIERMADKAQRHGVVLRPHFKTHQSAQIGEWFREFGIDRITVSSVEMAHYFAQAGWRDITIAFPVNIRAIDTLNMLAQTISLNLLVESTETVSYLIRHLKQPATLWLKIDTGYGRTGVPSANEELILTIAEQIVWTPHLQLGGLLAHAGHSYHARSPEEVVAIFDDTRKQLYYLKTMLEQACGTEIRISVGDTPGCSLATTFDGIDEIRPGNFVFYDLMQWRLGACQEEDIAVALACPVVAKHADRNEVIIQGGAVHLSKEALQESDGSSCYGLVCRLLDDRWSRSLDGARVRAVSQEHGIISMPRRDFERVRVGELLVILPVHSCLTANLMGSYLTFDHEALDMMR